MSLFDESSARKRKIEKNPHNYTKHWPFSYSLCAITFVLILIWKKWWLPTFNIRAQLQLRHLSLQEGIDCREVLCSSVGQQHCIDTVQVADQLPKASMWVRTTIHQHGEPVDREEGAITTASGEHVAAGTGQFEKAHSSGGRQEVEGRQRVDGACDEGGEFPHSLHYWQHLRGVDVQRESVPQRLVSQEDLPPQADVGTAEGQTEFGGADFWIYELKQSFQYVW